MIESTTYWYAKCDICGDSSGKGLPTMDQELAQLREEAWFVITDTLQLACRDCVKRIAAKPDLVTAILVWSTERSEVTL